MYEQNYEKQSDAASTGTAGRGSVSTRPPLPHELTAEWTVRAQLTFARAGEPVRREFNINDPINPVRVVYKWSNLDTNANSATNVDNDSQHEMGNNISNKCSRHSTPLKPTNSTRRSHSFRSTTSSTGHMMGGGSSADYGGDSAFGGSNGGTKIPTKSKKSETVTAAHYGTRCQSTCNIVVSAVADFLPSDMPYDNNNIPEPTSNTSAATDYFITEEEEPDPYTFSTTASYIVLPQKSFDEYSSPATPKRGRVLALVDAMCQTSDTETKYFEEQERHVRSHSPKQKQQQQRKYYEQRRATADALLSSSKRPYTDEGHNSLPSYSSSPGQTFKSSSMSRIPPTTATDFLPFGNQMSSFMPQMASKTTTDAQKKPRTVHIDVYCTGSEEDEHADGEISSSASENDKHYEMESNSTPQTVLDNEQMRLRHRRVYDKSLPRRLVHSQINNESTSKMPITKTTTTTNSSNMHLGHAITKSSTAEEVTESKQLLFRKHIGDQRAAKLQNLKQKYTRQASMEDVLSTSYANSSRSTMHDATCSSISSFVPSNHADLVDAPWKETMEDETAAGLTKSDSFDYDNSLDRLRIKRMERFWSRSISSGFTTSMEEQQEQTNNNKYQNVHPLKLLQTISEGNSQRDSPFSSTFQRNDTLSESENYPEHESTNSPICMPQQTTIDSPMDSPPTDTNNYLQEKSHYTCNRPGFLQFFGPSKERMINSPLCFEEPASAPVLNGKTEPTYPIGKPSTRTRWKSETRDINTSTFVPPTLAKSHNQQQLVFETQRCTSEAPAKLASHSAYSSPLVARRFELHRESPVSSVRSEASTVPSGYTPEYLQLARKFGKVVAVRKPGHHVGPTKNPNCSCESCQRWLAERFQIRARAFSLGECPVLKRPPK